MKRNNNWITTTFKAVHTRNYSNRWCSKTTKLQDQDHLFFQDQDRFF